MRITLKKASLAEAGRIHALQAQAFRALWEKYRDPENPGIEPRTEVEARFRDPGCEMYFICLEDAEVGFVTVFHRGRDFLLHRIGLLPEMQGKGYAQTALRLTEALYPQAESWGLDTIRQEPGLVHLYEKLGYRPTGETEALQPGMDLVFYRKTL